MRVLTLSSLFPGRAQPRHGLFVLERMRDFRDRTGAEVTVVSPVPLCPRLPERFLPSRWRPFAQAPAEEEVAGFRVLRPRYPMLPRIGDWLQGLGYYVGVRPTVRRLVRRERVDLLDVHYAYPDGFAGALLAHRLRLPWVLTVRGTDVNLLPELGRLRGQIRFALSRADRVVAVARALADLAVEAGADPRRVVVLPNGVDIERFRPVDRAEARRRLDLDAERPVLVTVGFLVPRKGHALLFEALARFPAASRPLLLVVGDGPEEGRLKERARSLGLENDTRFLGPRDPHELPDLYAAADASVLASSREGWPNVVLESLACGTPVVATAVHGTPEILSEPGLGVLVRERSPQALHAALVEALGARFDRARIRRFAEKMSWAGTSLGLRSLFLEVLEERRR